MTTEAKNLEEMIRDLSPHEREAVKNFVESLVTSPAPDERGIDSSPAARFEALFGSWDSGDKHSADNERIDADLAREYADTHEHEK